MKPKTVLKIFAVGIIGGFFSGLVKALQVSLSHQYFHYRMHRLILFNLTEFMNKGVIIGLGISIVLILFIGFVLFLRKKFLSPYFDFKIMTKKETTPLIKGSCFILIFAYLIYQIIEHARSPITNVPFFLGHSAFILFLFFLALRIDKIDFKRVKFKLLNFTGSRGMRITAVFIITVFVLLNLTVLSQKIFPSHSRPNVLLLVCDTLRADHLGCYGYNRPTSPFMDQFAVEALLFENAMSNSPWTRPSMGSLFTSLYPHQHQAFYWEDNLDNSFLTLAEIFRNCNYSTFAVQTNVLLTEYYNFHQGFQHFDEIINDKAEKVTDKFNSWVTRNKNKPFFAYLHFMDVHLPYEAPQDFKKTFEPEKIDSVLDGVTGAYEIRILNEIGLSRQDKQHLINIYDAEIRYFDHHIGQMINTLKKLGIFNNTIIVLTSDHGEEFWEHNGFEHGHTLYKEVIHVPLIIKYSSKLPPKRIQTCVNLLDLTPSLLWLCGIKNNFSLTGRNIILDSKIREPKKEKIFFEAIGFGAEKKGVIKDGWKLIENTGIRHEKAMDLFLEMTPYIMPEYEKGYELYNTNLDSQEQHNLIDEFPQIADRLKTYLELFKSESMDSRKSEAKDLEKKLKDLKSLGYIK